MKRKKPAGAVASASLAAAMARQAPQAAELLKAMAHPHRLRVLCLLVDGERSVGDINRDVDLSQSALSQHLAKLRSMDLVATRRDRQMIYYSCKSDEAVQLLQALDSIFGAAEAA